MSVTSEQSAAVRAIVKDAIQKGTADNVTKKILVAAVIKRLGLQPGHFDSEQRTALAEIARPLLNRETAESPKRLSSKPAASKKGKQEPDTSKAGRSVQRPRETSSPAPKKAGKKKAAVIADSDDEDQAVASSATDSDGAAQKSKKASSKTAKSSAIPAASKKRKSDSKSFRTAEFLNSEGDPIDISNGDDESASDEEVGPSRKKRKGAEKIKASKKGADKAEKKPRAKKAAQPEDPEEEEIKKLKSFVVACGLRKQWTKEFAKEGADTAKSQIRYLKKLLVELGMPSRMSLAAAKEIGAQRALEKEAADLGIEAPGYTLDDADDRPRRRAAATRRPPPKQTIKIDSDDDDDPDEDAAAPGASDDSEDGRGKKNYVPGGKEDGSDDDDGESGSGSSSEAEATDSDEAVAKAKTLKRRMNTNFERFVGALGGMDDRLY